ncbi:MAG: bifunctional demethylmenaquinone methyltransferase/2-methoxy-6-polyprenyl-1,4-benzoquinol methylase UbiE [Magnetococcales bacterium]|nr:bifunctional demethylmenaquinone methyltransferase/2-methoxy-6-polyprenyl-1,4-benzoquinol methylase UbiE [Magnetococcales bacterium]
MGSDGSATTHFGFSEIPLPDKVHKVREVFDSVAENYDLMNDLMSMGVHRVWKRYTVHKMRLRPGDRALDMAGGTGDLTRLMSDVVGEKGRVTLCDINESMVLKGRDVLTDKGLLSKVDWTIGNAEQIPLADNQYHVAVIGFGIRNVTDIDAALREMVRVLRPGGQFVCLEFSRVAIPFLRPFYDMYSFKVLPEIGARVANDRDSYQYLVESIRRFPTQDEFKEKLEAAGLSQVTYYNVSAGIAAVHIGYKV